MQSSLQGVHAQSDVHARAVGEEGSQGRLNKQAKNQDPVPVGQKIKRKRLRQFRFKLKRKEYFIHIMHYF